MRTRDLTPSQQRVMDLIREFVQQNGFPPTRVEIQKHCGWRSVNAAQAVLKALQRKGLIEVFAHRARGIKITWQGST
jgi:repressor LexA